MVPGMVLRLVAQPSRAALAGLKPCATRMAIRILKPSFVIASLMGATAAAAHAQDQPRVGLTTGYPASIGVLWHVSERTAIRPQFSFTRTSSSSDSLIDATTDFWSLGTEVSVLFLSPVRDDLKLYVAPRFGYSRTTGTTESSESTTDTYSFGGMFGGHYTLGRRFSLFGEAGLQYSHSTGVATSAAIPAAHRTNTGDSWGTRTGIGVVIYF